MDTASRLDERLYMGLKPPHNWNTSATEQGLLKHVSRGTSVLVVLSAVQTS